MKSLFLIISLLISINLYSSPRLLIKFPTRERSEKFFNCLDLYYKNLSGRIPYKFLISCDLDDLTMNCNESIERLSKYPNLFYYFGDSKSKVEAINKDIEKHLDFDILLIASDDMTPLLPNYDEIIINNMLKYFPNFDGVLHFNDGRVGEVLNTLPIIGRNFYEMFNYVYYPGYKSVYCDLELTDISKHLKRVKYIDQVIIKHDFGLLKDKLYLKNESKEYSLHDYSIYLNRKASNFDLEFENTISSLDIWGIKAKNQIVWSIIVPVSNALKFTETYLSIIKQIETLKLMKQVEVLFLINNKLDLNTKTKKLLEDSNGQYYSFLNDTVNIGSDYIKKIYDIIISKPSRVKPLSMKMKLLQDSGVYKKEEPKLLSIKRKE